MFIDNYLRLCEEKGISPTRVLKEIGISHSLYAKWKTGSEPTNRTKKKIADYFGVTTAELANRQIKNPAALSGNGVDDQLDAEIIDLFGQLSFENKGLALALLRAISDNQ